MTTHNKWTAARWKKEVDWDEQTWKKFLIFSNEEADALISYNDKYWAGKEKNEVTTWDDIPLGAQQLVCKELHKRLNDAGVSTSPSFDKLLIWRMRQAMRTKIQGHHGQDKATNESAEPAELSRRPFYDPVWEAARQGKPSPSDAPSRT